MITVAALYIDEFGPYPELLGVEWWGLPYRDARRYEGPHPVVAHPPCGAWGRLRTFHRKRDRDCAPRAVDQVRAWGGVLEHPSGSLLWDAVAMPRPGQPDDQWGGYTLDVYQSDWGHLALKRTWLYCVNVPRSALCTPEPRRNVTHVISTTRKSKVGEVKECTAQQRRRTPPLFAEYLVSLARAAAESRAA